MRNIVFVLLLGTCSLLHAQLFDSIEASFKYKPKPLIKLDTRNSFVTSTYSKLRGVKVGLSYHRTFSFGVGYNWMKNDFKTIHNFDSVGLRFGYVSTFLDYTFYRSKNWQFDIPVQLGFGRISYKNDEGRAIVAQWVPIWEPAMTFQYIFLKYFAVGVGAGYRVIIKTNTPISERFTSPIYIFKFRILFADIYQDVIK